MKEGFTSRSSLSNCTSCSDILNENSTLNIKQTYDEFGTRSAIIFNHVIGQQRIFGSKSSTKNIGCTNRRHYSVTSEQSSALMPKRDTNYSHHCRTSRIVDYVVLIGLDWDVNGSKVVGRIHQRFPSVDWPDVPFNDALVNFCQPTRCKRADVRRNDIGEVASPSFKSFVLTDVDGRRQYCSCMTFLCHSEPYDRDIRRQTEKCLVVVSRFDFIEVHRQILIRIMDSVQRNHANESCTNNGSNNSEGGRGTWSPDGMNPSNGSITSSEKTIGAILQSYEISQSVLDTPSTGSSVYLFVTTAGIYPAMMAVNAALTEQKVVCISRSVSQLYHACRAIRALLHPFKYNHVYVPLLTEDMLDILDAPTPYIVGVRTCHYAYLMNKLNCSDSLSSQPTVSVVLDLDIAKLQFFPANTVLLRPCKSMRRTIKPKLAITFHNARFATTRKCLRGTSSVCCLKFVTRLIESIGFHRFIEEKGCLKGSRDIFDLAYEDDLSVEEIRDRLLELEVDTCDELHFSAYHRTHSMGLERPLSSFPYLDANAVSRAIQATHRTLVIKPSDNETLKHYQLFKDKTTLSVPMGNDWLEQQRISIVRECASSMLRSGDDVVWAHVQSAVDALKEDTVNLRHVARLELCDKLEDAVKFNSVGLDAYQFTAILLRASLFHGNENQSTSEFYQFFDHEIAVRILRLSMRFYLRQYQPDGGRQRFIYDYMQSCKIWDDLKFWELAFFSDLQAQLVELYSSTEDNDGLACATVDTNKLKAIDVTKLAFRLVSRNAHKDYSEVEELTILSLALHYIHQIGQVRLNHGMTQNDHDLLLKFIRRFIERVCDETLVTESCQSQLIEKMQQNFQVLVDELNDSPNIISESEIRTTLNCGEYNPSNITSLNEKIIRSFQDVILCAHDRWSEGLSDGILNARGKLIVTEYCVMFVGKPQSDFISGQILVSIPICGLIGLKRLAQSDNTEDYLVQLNSTTFECMHIRIKDHLNELQMVLIDRQQNSRQAWLRKISKIGKLGDHGDQYAQLSSPISEHKHSLKRMAKNVLKRAGGVSNQSKEVSQSSNCASPTPITRSLSDGTDTNETDDFTSVDMDDSSYMSLTRSVKYAMNTFDQLSTGSNGDGSPAAGRFAQICFKSGRLPQLLWLNGRSFGRSSIALLQSSGCTNALLGALAHWLIKCILGEDLNAIAVNESNEPNLKSGRRHTSQSVLNAFVRCILTTVTSHTAPLDLCEVPSDQTSFSVFNTPILRRWYNSVDRSDTPADMESISSISSMSSATTAASPYPSRSSMMMSRFFNNHDEGSSFLESNRLLNGRLAADESGNLSSIKMTRRIFMKRLTKGRKSNCSIGNNDLSSNRLTSCKSFACLPVEHRNSSWTTDIDRYCNDNQRSSQRTFYVVLDRNCISRRTRESPIQSSPNGKFIPVPTQVYSLKQGCVKLDKQCDRKLLNVCTPNDSLPDNSCDDHLFSDIYACGWLEQVANLLSTSAEICRNIIVENKERISNDSASRDDSLSEIENQHVIVISLDNAHVRSIASQNTQANSNGRKQNEQNGEKCCFGSVENKGKVIISQISSLLQLLVDPCSRTMSGFQSLLEKHWISNSNIDDRSEYQKLFMPTLHFVQFLDCVHQLLFQFPLEFEFNDDLLQFLAYHSSSGRFYDLSSYQFAGEYHDGNVLEYMNRFSETSIGFYNLIYHATDRVLVPNCRAVSLEIWQYYLNPNSHLNPPLSECPNNVATLLTDLNSVTQRRFQSQGTHGRPYFQRSMDLFYSIIDAPCPERGFGQMQVNTLGDSAKRRNCEAATIATNESLCSTSDKYDVKASVSSIGSAFDVFNNVTSLPCLTEGHQAHCSRPTSPNDNSHDHFLNQQYTSSTIEATHMERTSGAERCFCAFEGWIKKRSISYTSNSGLLNLKQWKQRWLVLDTVRHELRYYDQQPSIYTTECSPKGRIPLSTVISVKSCDTGDDKAFEVATKTKIHLFAANALDVSTAWVESIRKCLGEC
ncbi:hypothetical protein ACOME3_009355 [Neoechinorhynchus agilis]